MSGYGRLDEVLGDRVAAHQMRLHDLVHLVAVFQHARSGTRTPSANCTVAIGSISHRPAQPDWWMVTLSSLASPISERNDDHHVPGPGGDAAGAHVHRDLDLLGAGAQVDVLLGLAGHGQQVGRTLDLVGHHSLLSPAPAATASGAY